jgi:membrane protease YdiL (CAAX protease family)
MSAGKEDFALNGQLDGWRTRRKGPSVYYSVMQAGPTRAFRRRALALGRVLLFWLATMAVLAISGPFAGTGNSAILNVGALAVPATFALTFLFIKWEGKRLGDYCLAVTRDSWLRLTGGHLLGFLLVAGQATLIFVGGGVHWVAVSPTPTMFLAVLGYLLLAIREELAFRGYPLRKLASDIDPWTAQVVVAALFVIEHRFGGSNWENALLGSGMGALVFGMAALASRGLALPIGIHAAWNIGDWALGNKGDGGLWHVVMEPGSAVHAERVAMASYVAVMSVAFLGLWRWYRLTRVSGR